MYYSGITTCDVANGEGIGVVLWVSGCDVKCKGCHNKETWDIHYGKKFDERVIENLLLELEKPETIRLTISGGHPLMSCNRETVSNLIQLVRASLPHIKIWLYTGYYYKDMDKDCKQICKMCDVVVEGPFIEEEKDTSLEFRGSKNQNILTISGNRIKQKKKIM